MSQLLKDFETFSKQQIEETESHLDLISLQWLQSALRCHRKLTHAEKKFEKTCQLSKSFKPLLELLKKMEKEKEIMKTPCFPEKVKNYKQQENVQQDNIFKQPQKDTEFDKEI